MQKGLQVDPFVTAAHNSVGGGDSVSHKCSAELHEVH